MIIIRLFGVFSVMKLFLWSSFPPSISKTSRIPTVKNCVSRSREDDFIPLPASNFLCFCFCFFFFFGTPTLLTITLINNYTIYKSIQYSTYITYNPIWHFYTEQKKGERKTTYNAFNKEVRIKDKTNTNNNTKNSVTEHKTLKNKV